MFTVEKSSLESNPVDSPALDSDLLSGFFSSVSNFTKGLAKQSLSKIEMETTKLIYSEIGALFFIVHCLMEECDSVAQRQINGIQKLCTLIFGPPTKWDRDFLDFHGFHDVIDNFFERCLNDPVALVNGVEHVLIDNASKDK
eukprot:Sdes_comp17023_c0_seq1m6222